MNILDDWGQHVRHYSTSHDLSDVAWWLSQSYAWQHLESPELGTEVFDAASQAGNLGWPWIEYPGRPPSAKRSILRALCVADLDELARWCFHLDRPQAAYALNVALRDERTSDEHFWMTIKKTWPLVLELPRLPSKHCSDWSFFADRASLCNLLDSQKLSHAFLDNLSTPDRFGNTFASAWIDSACSRGYGIYACALALRSSFNESPGNLLAQQSASVALARSAGTFLSAQSDPKTSCAAAAYWDSWRLLEPMNFLSWEQWIHSTWKWTKTGSFSERRACPSSWLAEALVVYQETRRPTPLLSEGYFSRLVDIGYRLLETWTPPHSSNGAEFHVKCLQQSLVAWALELGPHHQGGWASRMDELAKAAPQLGTLLEQSLLHHHLPLAPPLHRTPKNSRI